MNADFWRGKRVFVTGHTGFKGSWFVQMLDALGAEVVGYALPPDTDPSLFQLARLEKTLHSVEADVRDAAKLAAAIQAARPQVVFHLAAQALVRRSYRQPVETYATNIMGTVHLLEAIRTCPDVRAVVVVTTDKCYRNQEWCWGYRESDPLGGHDPYSSSKACAELVCDAYRSSFFRGGDSSHPAAIATARAGNVIGGGDWAADRLVPDCIRAMGRGETIAVRNPHATRPWQHVLEPLRGYLMLAEGLWHQPERTVGGWNFGPSESDVRSVEKVVGQLVENWGGGAQWQIAPDASMHEAMALQLDCSKAHQGLRWQPRSDLDTALRWTVDWYRKCRDGADARSLCREQIDAFMALKSTGAAS